MTPTEPEPTAAERTRAAELADEATKELIATRRSVERAKTLFQEADDQLRFSEKDFSELYGQANKVRQSDPKHLVKHLLDAQSYAKDARTKLGLATERFTELDTTLGEATTSITAADKALDELERLPGGHTEQVRNLRRKLEEFRDAVREAGEDLKESRGELGTADTNLEPLLDVPELTEAQIEAMDLDTKADHIHSVTTGVDGQLKDLRQGLTSPLEKVGSAASEAGPVADESVKMEETLRLAANPTPEEQFVAPGTAQPSELSRRLAGGPARDPELEKS